MTDEASHVPYRGSLPALKDLVAGHIPMMVQRLAPATGLIEGMRLRGARHLEPGPAIPRSPTSRRSTRPACRATNSVVAGYGGIGADAEADPRQAQRRDHCGAGDAQLREQILKYDSCRCRTAAWKS